MKKILLSTLFFALSLFITAQVIDSPASDITVECDGNGNTVELNAWLTSNGGATASSTCGNVTWTNDFTSLNEDYCSGSTIVTFTATGDCGTETTTAAFTIYDVSPPILVSGGSSMSVSCENSTEQFNNWVDSFTEDNFSDLCSNVSVSLILSNESPDCGEIVEAYFEAVDNCGNASAITSYFSIEEAQNLCPTTPIILTSQAEVDAFDATYPNCTDIQNGLVISGADITDLTPLSVITEVHDETGSGLVITNNPLLETLDGMNLTSISGGDGGLFIGNNDSLLDISALSSVTHFGGFDFGIYNNPLLNSLSGLENLINTWFLVISNNDSLTTLEGLSSELSVSELIEISDNSSLQSFGTSMGGELPLELRIENNSVLSDISALEANFSNPTQLATITIVDNPYLAVCDVSPVCNALVYWGILDGTIQNNAEGCNTITQVAYNCGLIPSNDDCEDAVVLIPGQPEELYDDYGSTSSQAPSCNDINRIDVWFAFFSGDFTSIDIITSGGYNLQLWEGTTCDTLIHVPDACGENSLLDIPVTQNTNYFIQVWSCQSCRPSIVQSASGLFNIVVQDGALSTQEFSSNKIEIFPNPVNNVLNINATQSIDNIEVYNLLGQKVLENTQKTMETQVGFSAFKTGIYLVKIISSGKEQIFKVVKE